MTDKSWRHFGYRLGQMFGAGIGLSLLQSNFNWPPQVIIGIILLVAVLMPEVPK